MSKIAGLSRLAMPGLPELPGVQEVYVNFGKKSDGWTFNEMDDGSAVNTVRTNASANLGVVSSGAMRSSNIHTLGNAANYWNVALGGTLTRVGTCFRFLKPGSEVAGSAVALGSWTTIGANPLTGSVHLVVHPTGWDLGYTNAGTVVRTTDPGSSGALSLAFGEWYTIELFFKASNNTFRVRLPGGTFAGPYTNATAGGTASPVAFLEAVHTATNQYLIEFRSFGAESRQFRSPNSLNSLDVYEFIGAQAPMPGSLQEYTASSAIWAATTTAAYVEAPTGSYKTTSCLVNASGKAIVEVEGYFEKASTNAALNYEWTIVPINTILGTSGGGASVTKIAHVASSTAAVTATGTPNARRSFLITGMTPGPYTFYLQHRKSAGSGTDGLRVDSTNGKALTMLAYPAR